MKDLVSEGGKSIFVTLSVRQLEELGDFQQGDDIEMNIKGIVKKIDVPPVPVAKEGEEKPEAPDYNENPDELKEERFITIELQTGEVLNEKPERKRAKSLNLTPEEVNHIKNKSAERKAV